MWCYQKPGFEALLLAELQRQQQCSQFCDTLLKTEGVSVPAHSCILSAFSPHISSALSSTPPPPAGQSRLLEFQALGACTLLRVVRLLYSGEMAGEGEKEKQEAISAAAKLGIHGLVEVTRGDHKKSHEDGEGQCADVGVQTEPLLPEENEGRRGRWRREVRDGSTFLWKEILSVGEKDTWTQTEELQANTAPPSHPAASFETIDMASLQSLAHTDPNLFPPQIPYIPISLVYPLDENQTHQPSAAPMDSLQEFTAAEHSSVTVMAPPHTSLPPSLPSFSSKATPCAADPQSWWTGPQGTARDVVAAEEWEDTRLEQFQGNIPGYINYFLNPDKEEDSRRGRARGRRRGAGVGGARRAGAGERRTRRPRAKTGGRGARSGLTQTVDVQEVGVSKLQKLFLQRWGMSVSRTGQGGGAVGRKLYLKTREFLKPAKICQRRRVHCKMWEFSQSRDVLPYSEGGVGNTQRRPRNTTQPFNQDDLPLGRPQRARAKSTTSLSFSSPPMRFYNVHTLSASRPSLQPSPSSGLLSPAASYVSPALCLLHTTSVPPLPPPHHEERPEHIDRLLEEVMMGLDILPNNSPPRCQPTLPASSSSCTYAASGNTLAQNIQQSQAVAVVRGVGSSSAANSEVPILQQQGEGELNEMLERFLLSFEQHIDNCTAREEVEVGGQSCPEAPVGSSQISEQQHDETETPARPSQPLKTRRAVSPKRTEEARGNAVAPDKRRKKRRKNEYVLSLEKKRVRLRNPAPSRDTKSKVIHDRGDKQLQQMAVVKLERSGPLPVRVTLQGHRQSLDVKSLSKTKTSSSSEKCRYDRSSDKNQTVWCSTKTYPIRSRFREAHMDSMPFLEEPLVQRKRPPSASQPGRRQGRSKNEQLLSSSDNVSSTPPIQAQPVEPCGTEKQLEKNQETPEQELTVQPQEETDGPTRRGKKRGAEAKEETSDDATVGKRVCFEQMPQPTSETCTPPSESADIEPATIQIEEIIDVETVMLTSVGDCFQREERDEKPVWNEIKLRETEECSDEEMESSGDKIIDAGGDVEDGCQKDEENHHGQSRTAPISVVSLGSTGSWEWDKEEDIDVIGGSGPAPDPVTICWTESSEGEKEEEDEDVDVVGEKTDYTSSVVIATMS